MKCVDCGKEYLNGWGDKMNYKEKTIQVLREVAEKCDKEASAMIKNAKNREWDGATDAMVLSSILMNIHIQANMLIMKVKTLPDKKQTKVDF